MNTDNIRDAFEVWYWAEYEPLIEGRYTKEEAFARAWADDYKLDHVAEAWHAYQAQAAHAASEKRIAALQADNKRLVEVVQEFCDWNVKYPSSRIFSHYEIGKITSELDAIYAKAREALPTTESLEDK